MSGISKANAGRKLKSLPLGGFVYDMPAAKSASQNVYLKMGGNNMNKQLIISIGANLAAVVMRLHRHFPTYIS